MGMYNCFGLVFSQVLFYLSDAMHVMSSTFAHVINLCFHFHFLSNIVRIFLAFSTGFIMISHLKRFSFILFFQRDFSTKDNKLSFVIVQFKYIILTQLHTK